MKIFRSEQVKEIDSYTIKNEPIASIDLMERASLTFLRWFMRKYDSSRKVMVFAGPGNNGGDGLAIARLLNERFFKVEVVILKFSSSFSGDFSTNLDRLKDSHVKVIMAENEEEIPQIPSDCILIDAIFGSGLSRKASGLPAQAIKAINNSHAEVVSVDIPSGLFGEDNGGNDYEAIVKARYTLSFEFPFLSFFFPENEIFTGRWKVFSIGLHPEIIGKTESQHKLVDLAYISTLIKNRSRFSHKGHFGNALLIAGCDGMMGAAVLAVKSCLRTGAGLVTAHVPRKSYGIIQTAVPESLISIDQSDIIFTDLPDLSAYSAVAAGPGLGTRVNTTRGLEKLLRTCRLPLVLDADALNIISANPDMMELLPEGTILTPHPKEFDRLFGSSENMYARHKKQLEQAQKRKLIIVLKQAYTFTALPDGTTWINSTGNPGMATGGTGDVLTGMILSLLAQGYSPEHASVLGVYLHGLAADLALDLQSHESLTPGDIIDYIGRAFKIAGAKQ